VAGYSQVGLRRQVKVSHGNIRARARELSPVI
jgi:hypothetical protein